MVRELTPSPARNRRKFSKSVPETWGTGRVPARGGHTLPYVPPEPQVGMRRAGPALIPLGPDDARVDWSYDGRYMYHMVGASLRAYEHGKWSTYSTGCRCRRCMRARKIKDMTSNGAQPYVDAAEARARLAELRAVPISWDTLAEQTGVDKSSLKDLLRGSRAGKPRTKVRKKTRDAVMSFELDPESMPPRALIDASLSYHRIRSLHAAGWTDRDIFRAMGREGVRGRANHPLHADREHDMVSVLFAKDVRTAAEKLAVEDSAICADRWVAAGRTRARKRSAEFGWPPPAAWDDPGTLVWPEHPEDPLPEKVVIDEIAIERAMSGVPTELTAAERGVLYHRLVESLDADPAVSDGRHTDIRYERAARGTGMSARSIAGAVSTYRQRYHRE